MKPIRFTQLGRILCWCVLTPHVNPVLGASATARVDEMRMLEAIAQVESGTRNLARPSKKIGTAGERSAWQITKTTWRRYTSEAFEKATSDATLAHLVAQIHLRCLRLELDTAGIGSSPINLALAWNAGPAAVIRGRIPNGSKDYADRVVSIYETLTLAKKR